jgi:hypothetical protein
LVDFAQNKTQFSKHKTHHQVNVKSKLHGHTISTQVEWLLAERQNINNKCGKNVEKEELLVGMQITTAITENSGEVPSNTNMQLQYEPLTS